jgi:hypothetical protein
MMLLIMAVDVGVEVESVVGGGGRYESHVFHGGAVGGV